MSGRGEGPEARAAAPRAVTRGESGYAVSIDWLAFSYFPKSSSSWQAELRRTLEVLFGAKGWEVGRGWQGYECSARCGAILVAWGGEAQQGTVHVEVPGSVAGAVFEWAPVVDGLVGLGARITRVDIAGDDFHGATLSVGGAVAAYRAGAFAGGGRPPSARVIDDLGSGAGSTLYVGRRENGKLLRCYEKGKQLGARESRWVRAEVELRAKDRVIPFDVLLRPAEFLAGAYPYLSFFSQVVATVRAFKERARISYARAIEIARLHAGRVVNAIMTVVGNDAGRCVDLLRRHGLPTRLSDGEAIFLTHAGAS